MLSGSLLDARIVWAESAQHPRLDPASKNEFHLTKLSLNLRSLR
jgi:hypothetical protein